MGNDAVESVLATTPALASYQSPSGEALIDFCARGKAPLDFFSRHLYDDRPDRCRQTIRAVKAQLGTTQK